MINYSHNVFTWVFKRHVANPPQKELNIMIGLRPCFVSSIGRQISDENPTMDNHIVRMGEIGLGQAH